MQRLDQGTLLGCQAWAGTRQRRMVRKVELRPMRGRDTTSHSSSSRTQGLGVGLLARYHANIGDGSQQIGSLAFGWERRSGEAGSVAVDGTAVPEHEVAGLAADEDRLVASEKLVVPAIE